MSMHSDTAAVLRSRLVGQETSDPKSSQGRRRRVARGAFIALLVVAALLVPVLARNSYDVQLMNEVLIVGVLAMSLNILLGYAGLVSLGHAAFFGLGAYACALATKTIYPSAMLGLLAAGSVSGLGALVIGALCIRLSGLYFAMITLAFSQALYTIAYYWRAVTGGDDGMIDIPRPALSLAGIRFYDTASVEHFYYFSLAVLLVLILIMYRIVRSPFGVVLQAIRENADRVQFVGLNVWNYKLAAFVLAGTFGGLAGGLYAMFQGFISPELMYWSKSGEIVLMTVLGGINSFLGPLLGAALLIFVRDIVLTYTDYWKIVVGGILIVCVLFMPAGAAGFLEQLRLWLWRRINR